MRKPTWVPRTPKKGLRGVSPGYGSFWVLAASTPLAIPPKLPETAGTDTGRFPRNERKAFVRTLHKQTTAMAITKI